MSLQHPCPDAARRSAGNAGTTLWWRPCANANGNRRRTSGFWVRFKSPERSKLDVLCFWPIYLYLAFASGGYFSVQDLTREFFFFPFLLEGVGRKETTANRTYRCSWTLVAQAVMTRDDTGVFCPLLVRFRGLIYILTLQFVNLTECMRRWHELQSQNATANSNSPSNQWAFEEVGTKALTFPHICE